MERTAQAADEHLYADEVASRGVMRERTISARSGSGSPREPTLEERAYLEAKQAVDKKVGFYNHLVVWGATVLFFLVAAGFQAAVIIGFMWGIGLAIHGFKSVLAPSLRKKWIDEEVGSRVRGAVTSQRVELEGKHARSVEELSASIAHEIRNPITAAKSLVQQMGEDPSSAENVEYARVALEELDRVERSISHLLRFAREEEPNLSEMKLSDVIDSAIETFRERLGRSRAEIKREVDTEGTMRGDPEKLRRVIINLVGNALDALEERRPENPRIEILAGENLARTEVWLRVQDNGPGIEAETLQKIWSPFYTTKANGTGLGLALTKKVVEGHGGTIEVKSDPRRGTEFTIVLPKARSKEP